MQYRSVMLTVLRILMAGHGDGPRAEIHNEGFVMEYLYCGPKVEYISNITSQTAQSGLVPI